MNLNLFTVDSSGKNCTLIRSSVSAILVEIRSIITEKPISMYLFFMNKIAHNLIINMAK